MTLNDLERLINDPFFQKLFEKMVRCVGLQMQEEAPTMTVEELYDNEDLFPAFDPGKHQYLDKKIGYICRSPKGTLVKLIQKYDSTIYKDEPEALPAQWGFYWSNDPTKAVEFVKSSTSPYSKGNCCKFNDKVYRSTADNNVYSPEEYPSWWEEVPMETAE